MRWARPAAPWPTIRPRRTSSSSPICRSSSSPTAATRPSRSWPAWPTASACARSSCSRTSTSLSGGQRRRVDLMRVLFQEPELMILDEPTNHLDRSAKRWLLDELARFNGALLVVSHDLKLLDQSITKVLHIANQRLTEWKGNYSKFEALQRGRPVPARARLRARSARDQAPLVCWPTPCGRAPRSGPARPRRSTGGSSGWRRAGPRSTSATRRASSQLPTPPRSGGIPLEVAKLGVRYGSNEVLLGGDVPRRTGRPHRDHRPQRRREVLAAALPGRCAGAHQRRGRARGQRRARLLRAGARADRSRAHARWTT